MKNPHLGKVVPLILLAVVLIGGLYFSFHAVYSSSSISRINTNNNTASLGSVINSVIKYIFGPHNEPVKEVEPLSNTIPAPTNSNEYTHNGSMGTYKVNLASPNQVSSVSPSSSAIKIYSISQSSGTIGTTITLKGNFSENNFGGPEYSTMALIKTKDDKTAIVDVMPYNNTITFSIQKKMCSLDLGGKGGPCPSTSVIAISPGTYTIYYYNDYLHLTSNGVSFTVTGDPTPTPIQTSQSTGGNPGTAICSININSISQSSGPTGTELTLKVSFSNDICRGPEYATQMLIKKDSGETAVIDTMANYDTLSFTIQNNMCSVSLGGRGGSCPIDKTVSISPGSYNIYFENTYFQPKVISNAIRFTVTTPTVYHECSLCLSDFFRNDSTAQSILSGVSSYTVNQNIYLTTDNKINTNSFEYKLINAFRQLGYKRLTFTTSPSETQVSAALHVYQRIHNMTVSDALDKKTMSSIDSELHSQEVTDKNLARSYPPFSKFIEAPQNEPSNTHLAALYARFINSLSRQVPQIISIDDFRNTLANGLGGNLGVMTDAAMTHVMTVDEQTRTMYDKGDFRFCSTAYYANRLKTKTDCLNPPSTAWDGVNSDFAYMSLLIHEYGHGTGRNLDVNYSGPSADIHTIDNNFGTISFDMNNVFTKQEVWSKRLLRSSDIDSEFVSKYAEANSQEDYAESFLAYIVEGNIFRARAKNNQYLRQKYMFFRDKVFDGVEYDTGDMRGYQLWQSLHTSIEINVGDYEIQDPLWVWDYLYLYLPVSADQL